VVWGIVRLLGGPQAAVAHAAFNRGECQKGLREKNGIMCRISLLVDFKLSTLYSMLC